MAMPMSKKEQLGEQARRRFAAGDFHAAARLYAELARAEPGNPSILFQLGKAESLSGDASGAIRHLAQALKAKPDDPAILAQLAICQRQAGRLDDALKTSERAVKASPTHEFAHWSRADLLRLMGRYDEAYALLKPLAKPGADSTLLTIYAMLARRVEGVDRAIELLQEVASRDDLPPTALAQSLFQLGEMLDRAGRYDEAFAVFERANAIRRRPYDADALERQIDEMIETWTPEFLAGLPRSTITDDRPVFIVGMMRSGSTLCEQIVSSHPAVFPGGELKFMREPYENLLAPHGGSIARAVEAGAITEKSLTRAGRGYLQKIRKLAGKDAKRVTDKMPYNWRNLGLISLMLPGARVIHTVRDPLDTCLSCYFHDFTGVHPYAYDPASLGAFHKHTARLIEHWKTVLDIPVFTLVYEDLIDDQERVTRALIEFLDLEWDDACLRFHENRRAAITHSNEQVREKLFSSSRGRHANYEKHIAPLREALGV